MQTVEESFVGTYEVKRSKFITHIVPISKYKGLQEKLKVEHPKSRHTVYALRYINEYDQIVENSSDDGEPKGAAGLPSLNVLRGEELVNVAILTVRYFGGIKLGIGGMARAYASAVKEAVAVADIIKYEKEYLLKILGIEQVSRDFLADKVVWKIITNEKKLNSFKEQECTR